MFTGRLLKFVGIAGWFGRTESVSWEEGSIPYGDYEAKRPEAEAVAAHYLSELIESPSDDIRRNVPLERAKKVVAEGLLRYRGRDKKNEPSYDLKCDGREIWWREYPVVATMYDDSEHRFIRFQSFSNGPGCLSSLASGALRTSSACLNVIAKAIG